MNLLGRKLGMLQVFDGQGRAFGVTVIETGPCVVTQVKTKANDGYDAVQVGFLDKKEKATTKPMLGHFKKAGAAPKRHLRESRVDDAGAFSVGQELKVGDYFKSGDKVDVEGISKGRGFAGGIRRHKMRRSPESHGGRTQRQHGSTGQSASISHVHKGTRMPGHMGACTTTVQSVRVFDVRPDDNQLLIAGAVPGPTNGIVCLCPAVKKRSSK